MENQNRVVIATTTFNRTSSELRAQLALKTVRQADFYGYPIVVVDDSPVPEVGEMFADSRALVEKQKEPGMGASRRQCFRSALALGAEVVVWMEPEKWTLVEHLSHCVDPVLSGKCDIVMPRRENLDSYPDYQHWSELRAIWEIAGITGRGDIDWMFGPRVWNRRAMELFLQYDGKSGPDNWEILVVPFIWAFKGDYRVLSITVPYKHPEEQTATEGGSEWNPKRDKQRIDLVSVMRTEAKRLGFEGGMRYS